jgi:serine/threonine protein kinase
MTSVLPDACDQMDDTEGSTTYHDCCEVTDYVTEFLAAVTMSKNEEPLLEDYHENAHDHLEDKSLSPAINGHDKTVDYNPFGASSHEEEQRPHDQSSNNTLHNKRFASPKDFELLKVIGMGAFGKVLQVRHKYSKQVMAMKIISKRLLNRKSAYVENIRAERDILTRVKHPFVVQMHCSFQTSEKLFIVMDYLAGGELFLRLGREGIVLERTAAFYLGEIILALNHLHSKNILHRDLKPENILLGSDGHVCLTDFGLAKDFGDAGFASDEDESRALTVCGTQEYMAPEMVARQGYGRPADYWSLGCIAYEMLKGDPPFHSKLGAKDLFRKIMTEKVKMPDGSTPAACKLLKGLLCRNPLQRWGVAKSTMFEVGGVSGLQQAAFFDGFDWDKLEKKEIAPPDTFDISEDDDTRHFHDEFTGMALPRSVIIMSGAEYRPRHVDSERFRGFSFVQEDFYLPERDEDEVKTYWNSELGDGESESECASSKCDNEQLPLEPFSPDKKKRPPRKKKKKPGVDGVSALPSESQTPDSCTAAVSDATQSSESIHAIAHTPLAIVSAVPANDVPLAAALLEAVPIPAAAAGFKKVRAVASSASAALVVNQSKPSAGTTVHTSLHIATKTLDTTVPAWTTKTAPQRQSIAAMNTRRDGWDSKYAAHAAATRHIGGPIGAVPTASTNWTQHRMEPRKSPGIAKTIHQVSSPLPPAPMWPSLAPPSVEPAATIAASKNLQGAWARKK